MRRLAARIGATVATLSDGAVTSGQLEAWCRHVLKSDQLEKAARAIRALTQSFVLCIGAVRSRRAGHAARRLPLCHQRSQGAQPPRRHGDHRAALSLGTLWLLAE